MEALSDEILQRIFSHAQLYTLIALSQTYTRFRALLQTLDASITRDKVLEHVPWMTPVDEEGSWLQCGQLALARQKSLDTKPKEWTFLDNSDASFYKIRTQLTAKTDVRYVAVKNVNHTGLPDSFDPLFDEEHQRFSQRNGIVQGKYMGINGGYLDATNFDWHRQKPDGYFEMPESWYGYACNAGRKYPICHCPFSGMKVSEANSKFFVLEQETKHWLVIKAEQKVQIVDKRLAKDNTLVFEMGKATVVLEHPGFESHGGDSGGYVIQFLPDDLRGCFVLEFDLPTKTTKLHYLDLFSNTKEMRLLATFPGRRSDYDWSPQENTEWTPRDFVVTYKGMLWLHYREKELIPLWVDLSRDNCTAASHQDTDTVRVRATKAPVCKKGQRGYRLYKAWNSRYVTHPGAMGRIVCDLATQTTYIVRDETRANVTGATFVALDPEEGPQFYTFTDHLLAVLGEMWMDPDVEEELDENKPIPYSGQKVLDDIRWIMNKAPCDYDTDGHQDIFDQGE